MGMTIYEPAKAGMSTLDKMIQNGRILYEPTVNGKIVYHPGTGELIDKSFLQQLVEGILWAGGKVLHFVATCGTELDSIFIVVAIVGFFFIMADCKKLGCKLTSGSIIGYLICKVVEAYVG